MIVHLHLLHIWWGSGAADLVLVRAVAMLGPPLGPRRRLLQMSPALMMTNLRRQPDVSVPSGS